jgi:DNA-directed RNA polymerase sigma subunit (sigma70/sigma32)
MEQDDLIHEGFLALAQAAQTFDPALGAGFATHAYIHIRGGMQEAIKRWARPIHLPFLRQ